jgi:predicted nucleotidyltransferase
MILTEDLKSRIKEIASRHGAINIRVFGSVARGTTTGDSDLDLLVDMKSGRRLFDLMDIQDEVAKVVGHKVDVVTERSLNRHIKTQVLEEAPPLWHEKDY